MDKIQLYLAFKKAEINFYTGFSVVKTDDIFYA